MISMQSGEMRLFSGIRAAAADEKAVSAGISYRRQIQLGTARKARQFAEVLAEVLVRY